MNHDWASDCIHLKACRRLSKIGNMRNRGCNDTCTAYTPNSCDSYVTVDEAVRYARNGVQRIQGGYDAYDVYCSCDLCGRTLKELVEEANER